MMSSENKKSYNEPPQPGTTIIFLEGEILSVKINQWGFFGNLKTKYGTYNYKLKDSTSATNDIIVGLKLVITNGYCYENKKKEIVVSDGKFGEISTEIEKKHIQLLNHDNTILIGRITNITQKENLSTILVEIPYPPFTQYKITIDNDKSKQLSSITNNLNLFVNKLTRIEGTGDFDDLLVTKIELLNESHFLHKLIELKNKEASRNTLEFSKIILDQINNIGNFHTTFKDILFNMRGEVSKNLLDDLSKLLLSKILDGEMRFPYNILISKYEIDKYFDSMIKHARDIIYGNSNLSNPEELVAYLRYYYPAFKSEEN